MQDRAQLTADVADKRGVSQLLGFQEVRSPHTFESGLFVLTLPRYTQPEQDQQLLLQRLHLLLPPQPAPRLSPTASDPRLEGVKAEETSMDKKWLGRETHLWLALIGNSE